eukprot:12426729-Karenia_brevis.AAC.2
MHRKYFLMPLQGEESTLEEVQCSKVDDHCVEVCRSRPCGQSDRGTLEGSMLKVGEHRVSIGSIPPYTARTL